MARKYRLIGAIALSLAASGCDSVQGANFTPMRQIANPYAFQPIATPTPFRRPSLKPQTAQPKPSRTPSAQPVATDPLQSLMTAVKQALSSIQNLTATIDSWNTNGQKSETVKTRISFMQPDHNRVDILQSTNSSAVGSKVVWSGTSQVTVRAKVLFVSVTLTLPQTDDRLVNARGYTVADVGLKRLIDIFFHPQTNAKWLGTSNMDGRNLYILELTSPLSPDDVSKERVGIDPETKLPVLRQLFQGDQMVFWTQLTAIQTNTPLDGSLFSL